MAHPKTSSKRVASLAGRTLARRGSTKTQRSLAASVLGQRHGRRSGVSKKR